MTSYNMEKVTRRYMWIQEQKKVTLQKLRDIKAEESNLEKQIKDYLTEYKEDGIQVDNHTTIYGQDLVRKSKVGSKARSARIKGILEREGLHDPAILADIMKASDGTSTTTTKIKIKVN